MTKRMGRAFLAAIKKEAEAAPGARESVLGNPQRRRGFQSLCLHPPGSIAGGARALGGSPPRAPRPSPASSEPRAVFWAGAVGGSPSVSATGLQEGRRERRAPRARQF